MLHIKWNKLQQSILLYPLGSLGEWNGLELFFKLTMH